MQSIFSVQDKNTITQAVQAKKQAKEDKKVQFANVAFSDFISKSSKILKSAALTDNISNIYKEFSDKNTEFKGLKSFVSHFDVSKLPQNAKDFEYSEEFFDRLNELIEDYKGTKGELKDAECFLLNLMKELVSEVGELGLNNLEFKGHYEAYSKQLTKKDTLKGEIVELANKYLDETDSFKGERLLGDIEMKLRAYYNASQDGDLRSFFAPLLPYLNDSAQENIIKALYTINEELKDPEAFELGGGKRLVWQVDGERIRFKILSGEDLQYFHNELQKSKSFKTISKSLDNKNEVKLDESAGLNLPANSAFEANLKFEANSSTGVNSSFSVSSSDSILKTLLQDVMSDEKVIKV